MVDSFLREDSEFIDKWGTDIVPIDICIAVNDVEKT